MNCNQYQDRILEYEQLTAGEQQSLDVHLRGCPLCREFAQQWHALDGALTQQLHAPMLSAGFDANLRQRITTNAAAARQGGLAERRQALDAEFAAIRQRNRLRGWIHGLLDVLGYGVAGGMGGWVLATLLTRMSHARSVSPDLTEQQISIATALVGMVIFLGLTAAVFCRPVRRFVLR